MTGKIKDFLSLTRMPLAFTQTLFIILGFVHAGGTDYAKIFLGILALGPAFIYGGIYILNDIADRDYDRLHPKKKHRVISSRKISPRTALFLAITLIAGGFIIALHLGAAFALISFLILTNNLLYSVKPRLKNHLYLGLLSCSLNYPLRFMAGSSIESLTWGSTLPIVLFLLVALHGFSAYRIHDIRALGANLSEKLSRNEKNLTIILRSTAIAAIFVVLIMLYGRNAAAAIGISAYMMFFSELNLRIVKKGVDLFKLLRIHKILKENPRMIYYPILLGLLAVFIVYATIA